MNASVIGIPMTHHSSTFPFDRDLDHERGRLAADRARASGLSALECAVARIEATFSPALRHSFHKKLVRSIMRSGTESTSIRRYVAVARQAQNNISLNEAVRLAAWCYSMEAKRRRDVFIRRARLHLMVLDELRLILRWFRRFDPKAFPLWREIIQGLMEDEHGR